MIESQETSLVPVYSASIHPCSTSIPKVLRTGPLYVVLSLGPLLRDEQVAWDVNQTVYPVVHSA